MTIHYESVETPVGPLLLGATSHALCLLEFAAPQRLDRQLAMVRRTFGTEIVSGTSVIIRRAHEQLADYFAGRRTRFDLPLDYRGTPFQVAVWQALLEIPYGATCSYGQLAKQLGDPGASRAIGSANGMNHIAIVIPCHRVVNSNGTLGGYGGGLERKRFLLDLERGQGQLFG
jgi:O-6-methylguanine DNA methyltransferase